MAIKNPSGEPQGKKTDPPEDYGHTSTVAVLHQHSMGVSTKEKIFLPFLFLGIGILLVGAIMVVRDHMTRTYRPVSDIAKVVEMAAAPSEGPGALAGLVNPDDSQYVKVAVRGWQFWSGKRAIVQGHYLRMEGIRAESVEQLVKGDRGGAATLTLRIDLSRSEGNRYHVDSILRGGLETDEIDLTVEIYPLNIAERPAVSGTGAEETYLESHHFDYKKENTYKGVKRFAVVGLLQRTENGLRIQAKQFNVALAQEMDPGLAAMIGDLAGEKVTANMTWYLDLEETFDWGTKAKPGRRQSAGEIGRARLDGVSMGKVYVANG